MLVGALAFLLYDICITFDDEVKFVWPKPWTLMKLLYFFIRYFPLCVEISITLIGSPHITPQFHFSPRDCFVWQVFQGIATILIVMTVDYILILRVYALYHSGWTMRRTIICLFGLEIAGMCVGFGLSLPTIEFDDICLVTHISSTLLIGGSILLFQSFLFALTAVRFVSALREGWGGTSIVSLIMRDGTWAFILIFAIMVGEASSLYALKNDALSGVFFGWLLTGFSFAGYRVLLNLSAYSPLPVTQTTTGTDIRFRFTTRTETHRDPIPPQLYELSAVKATTQPRISV
ncbi:hypothetical protein C8J57DRAFT_1283426 [Mycena rebaudengoi]|nr:hypothetical protein C8J57DRAFT_1283426 [Mycena rebaudengoi]